MNDKLWERWGLTIVLGLGFFAAVLAWQSIAYFFHDYHGFGIEFSKGMFEAIAIAMVIGLTVDQFLSKRFAREAFLASVGYVLPPELRPEMQWLCQLRVLCTHDVMVCNLTTIGDSIRFHVHRTQVVKNISHSTYSIPLGLGIDEWFRSEAESRIIKFSFVLSDGQSGAHYGPGKKSLFGMNLPEGFQSSIPLECDQEITITSEFEEICPRNGYWFMHMKFATNGARVTVNCPDDLGVYVDFANREGKNALKIGHDYVCPFTLLPYQRTAVRFWDKGSGEERMKVVGPG